MKRGAPIFPIASMMAVALSALTSSPARADFFDGARQTFQNDIPHFFTHDVPHFFQDDIPCAVVGHPTSGTKQSCSEKPDTGKSDLSKQPPPKLDQNDNPPPRSSQ